MKTVWGSTSKAASAARPSVRSSWPGLQTLAKASPDPPSAAGIQWRVAAAERGALGAPPQPQGCASAAGCKHCLAAAASPRVLVAEEAEAVGTAAALGMRAGLGRQRRERGAGGGG